MRETGFPEVAAADRSLRRLPSAASAGRYLADFER